MSILRLCLPTPGGSTLFHHQCVYSFYSLYEADRQTQLVKHLLLARSASSEPHFKLERMFSSLELMCWYQ